MHGKVRVGLSYSGLQDNKVHLYSESFAYGRQHVHVICT